MDARSHSELSARADLYLCLSRAFMTPRDPALAQAMREVLPEDLDDLAAQLDLDIAAPLEAYRAAMRRLGDPLALLQLYSATFLAPPTVASINAGRYLDGALNGGSVRAMEEAYRLCGVERDEGFHDLADHVCVQLEFVGRLYAAEARWPGGEADGEPLPVAAGAFLAAYPMRWVDRFCADLESAWSPRELPPSPYLALARILRQAVVCHSVVPHACPSSAVRRQAAIDRARAKYAGRGITHEDMARIRQKLEARGLSTGHLPAPPGLRGEPMGAASERLPDVR